jgi:hypothetical protein
VFEKMQNFEIAQVVQKHGLPAISALKDAQADFSSLDSIHIFNTLYSFKNDTRAFVSALKEAGAKFVLNKDDLKAIILQLGNEIISQLKNAGTDFSVLDKDYIKDIIEQTNNQNNTDRNKLIKDLHEAGTDFSKLDSFEISYLFSDLGVDINSKHADMVQNVSMLDTEDVKLTCDATDLYQIYFSEADTTSELEQPISTEHTDL